MKLTHCLLWEHEEAAELVALLVSKGAWYDAEHDGFWSDWVRDVFDLRTANAFGCAVWARILDVRLDLIAPATIGPSFGFGANNRNFGRGNFGRRVPGRVGLSVEQQRLVLRARYLQLISRGTVPEINRILHILVGERGPAWAIDNHDMTTTVFLGFAPDSQLRQILDNFPLIPVPTGVQVSYQFAAQPAWGFGEDNLNFEHGGFAE